MSEKSQLEIIATRLKEVFAVSPKKPRKFTYNLKYDPEHQDFQNLLMNSEWMDLPPEFLIDTTAQFCLTQDGMDYVLPGIAYACVAFPDVEVRDGARTVLSDICTCRSVQEWLITLNKKFSREQRETFHDAIQYIREHDKDFWINVAFDDAYIESDSDPTNPKPRKPT